MQELTVGDKTKSNDKKEKEGKKNRREKHKAIGRHYKCANPLPFPTTYQAHESSPFHF